VLLESLGSGDASVLAFAIENNTLNGPGGDNGIRIKLNENHDASENALTHTAFSLPLAYNSIRDNTINNMTVGMLFTYDDGVHVDTEISNNIMETMSTTSVTLLALGNHTAADNEIVLADNVFGTNSAPGGPFEIQTFPNSTGSHLYLFTNNTIYNQASGGLSHGLRVTHEASTVDITLRDNNIATANGGRGLEAFGGLSNPDNICFDVGISTTGANTFTGAQSSRILQVSGLTEVEDQANVTTNNSFTPGFIGAGTSVLSGTCSEPLLN